MLNSAAVEAPSPPLHVKIYPFTCNVWNNLWWLISYVIIVKYIITTLCTVILQQISAHLKSTYCPAECSTLIIISICMIIHQKYVRKPVTLNQISKCRILTKHIRKHLKIFLTTKQTEETIALVWKPYRSKGIYYSIIWFIIWPFALSQCSRCQCRWPSCSISGTTGWICRTPVSRWRLISILCTCPIDPSCIVAVNESPIIM